MEKMRWTTGTKQLTPVYFFSHGGPNIAYDTDHPVYARLQKVGKEITSSVKPEAIVVLSAHWQGEPNTILVNTGAHTELVYDFFGFPRHYYEQSFPHVGSPELAERVRALLAAADIPSRGVTRGLDHGVFSCFRCAFDPDDNPLTVPIVQVSLFDSEDGHQHYRLGQALAALRQENVVIIVSGMAVHNLRDMRRSMLSSEPLPYAKSFDRALKDAATASPAEREEKMMALLQRKDAREAHPHFDHLLPIFVGAGAAGKDRGTQLWTLPEGSCSWAQYRFGGI